MPVLSKEKQYMQNFWRINEAIQDSHVLTEEYKKFLLLYNRAMIQVWTKDLESTGMNKEEFEKAFSEEFGNTIQLSAEEYDRLNKDMINKFNDKNLNQKLSVFEKEWQEKKIYIPYFDLLKTYSHEMRNYPYFENLLKKINRSIYIITHGGTINQKEKLTLSEIGLLKKLTKLHRCIDIFNEKKIDMMPDEKFKKTSSLVAKAELLMLEISKLHEPRLYQSGDILVLETDRDEALRLKHTQRRPLNEENIYNALKKLQTRYGHAAQLTGEEENIKQSHLEGKGHRTDDLSFINIIQSDIFRLNISKLVDRSQVETLKKEYGENWREQLQTLYAKKIFQISTDQSLQGMSMPHGATVILPHWVGREENKYTGLFFQIDEGKKKLYKNKMVCSEFVARETAEAIKLVNEELSAKGLSNPIKSPFPARVNLSRVSPEKFISLLKKADCIDKIDPKGLDRLVNIQSNFRALSDQHVELTTELYDKLYSLAKKKLSTENFLKESKVAFIAYLSASNTLSPADYEKKKEKIDTYLDKELQELNSQWSGKKHGNFIDAFRDFFKAFIEFLGIKNNKNLSIIRATVKYLENESTVSHVDNSGSVRP